MAEKENQRYSTPPYYVAMMDGKRPVLNYSGKVWKGMERVLAPSAKEIQEILLRLRREFRWSRSTLAAFLGVSADVIRRWETGERNPSGAARRLLWLVEVIVFRPEKITSGLDWIVWGRGKELRRISRNPPG